VGASISSASAGSTRWLRARADRLAATAAASVAVFNAVGKVFSPQYLILLTPFVPLVRSRLATFLFGLGYRLLPAL
jgi:hypothetical protein